MKRNTFILFLLFCIVPNNISALDSSQIKEYKEFPKEVISILRSVTSPDMAQKKYKSYDYKYDEGEKTSEFKFPKSPYFHTCVIFWPSGRRSKIEFNGKKCVSLLSLYDEISAEEYLKFVSDVYISNGWIEVEEEMDFFNYVGKKLYDGAWYRVKVSMFSGPLDKTGERMSYIIAEYTELSSVSGTQQSLKTDSKGNNAHPKTLDVLSVETNGSYVDLGLPSGPLWKDENEKGYYNFDDATNKFGQSLPSEYQLRELYDKCEWRWENNGYRVIGLNGNSIFLPITGCYVTYAKGLQNGNVSGDYWSSGVTSRNFPLALVFNKDGFHIDWFNRAYKYAIRLVRKK